VSVSPAKYDLNQCNESPLRGEKPDFWPVSKNNTGSLPLRGILPVTKQTPHFRTYSGRASYDLPQTLHVDRARRAHPKKCHPFFDPTYSFSYRVYGKFWPNLPTRGFSAITP